MFGYGGIEFGLRLMRVTCALIASLFFAVAGSIFLAGVAHSAGMYADRVFNISGPALVVVIFYSIYLRGGKRARR